MAHPAIILEDVTRHFVNGDKMFDALSGINLDVECADRFAIIGPSGSGKTTLLNLIGALDRPDKGKIQCLGIDLCGISESSASDFRRRYVGLVFQDDSLMPELTVRENIELPLVLLGQSWKLRQEKVARILNDLALAHRADAFPASLSGGEKQRVAVARAVIHQPQLLIADEPTANLDTASAMRVLDTIDTLAAQYPLTVLLATHDTRIIERFPRVICLQDGKIIEPNLANA